MKRPAKILLGLTGGLVLALVVVAVAVPLLVDADAIRTRAEAEMSKALGRKVALGRPSVSIWSGLRLNADSVRIGEPLAGAAEGVPILEAGPTSVRLAFWPLVHRQVEARAIAIDEAKILQDGKPLLSDLALRSSLRIGADGVIDTAGKVKARIDLFPPRPEVEATFSTRLAKGTLALDALEAAVGPLRVTANGSVEGVTAPPPVAKLDVGLALAKSRLSGPLSVVVDAKAPSGRFELSSPRLDLSELAALPSLFAGTTAPNVPAGIELTDVRAVMTMDHGEVRLKDARYGGFGGTGRGTVEAHPFEPARAFRVDQHVEGVSIAAVLAAFAPAQKGTLDGTASLDVALSGRAGAPSLLPTLSGTGTLAVRDGTIKSAGVIQQVMKLLETAGATGFAKNETPFDRLSAHFNVASGVATTRDLEFRSKDLDFDGQGTVGLGGALKLEVLASFSREVTTLLVAKTRALSVRVNDAGRLTVPLQIRGTLQEPRVQLDVDKVLKEGVVKQLKKEGTKSLLKKLFGK